MLTLRAPELAVMVMLMMRMRMEVTRSLGLKRALRLLQRPAKLHSPRLAVQLALLLLLLLQAAWRGKRVLPAAAAAGASLGRPGCGHSMRVHPQPRSWLLALWPWLRSRTRRRLLRRLPPSLPRLATALCLTDRAGSTAPTSQLLLPLRLPLQLAVPALARPVRAPLHRLRALLRTLMLWPWRRTRFTASSAQWTLQRTSGRPTMTSMTMRMMT